MAAFRVYIFRGHPLDHFLVILFSALAQLPKEFMMCTAFVYSLNQKIGLMVILIPSLQRRSSRSVLALFYFSSGFVLCLCCD